MNAQELYRKINDLAMEHGWKTPVVFECHGEIYEARKGEIQVDYEAERNLIIITAPDTEA